MKTLVVYSGGIDSTVLLFEMLAAGEEVGAISFDYGQRHSRELVTASRICGGRGVRHKVVDFGAMSELLVGSSLTDSSIPVPDGHYTDESMKATVVPNRNMLMLSAAIAAGLSSGFDAVAYGAHAGDHTIYPDCRPEFVEAMQHAAALCDWKQIKLLAPFLKWSKADIVRRGAELNVPFEQTWSCYKGGAAHCGTCGTCVERREAFELAGIVDPTHYA
ncbi:MAG: 7-cyano-7-deazaguanine synthase QueC [Bdellovibrionales bacterium]|nr:7-cyano-7-deazaguanine synthase QueC [Bdellovibrionales bacterium]